MFPLCFLCSVIVVGRGLADNAGGLCRPTISLAVLDKPTRRFLKTTGAGLSAMDVRFITVI